MTQPLHSWIHTEGSNVVNEIIFYLHRFQSIFYECNNPRKEMVIGWCCLGGVVVNQVLFGEMKVVNQLEWGKTHSSPFKAASPSRAVHKGANC